MIKKILQILFSVFLLIALVTVAINVRRNNPELILKKLKGNIELTNAPQFIDYSDWLWQPGRTFVFEVVYMNIFSPGTATMSVKEETFIDGKPVINLEAVMEPNDFFKEIYDSRMVISSAIRKDTKVSLWYQELTSTPEKNKTKEIIFDPDENIATREEIKYKIIGDTYDPLSAFFNFLSSDFRIDEPIVLNLLSKEEIYEFKVVPTEVKNGIYKLKGEVARKDRSSTHGAKFTIWVKNGQVRVPLLMKVISAAGPIYVRLKSIK